MQLEGRIFFSGTPQGAHANARFYSLIETCMLHGHESYACLKHILKGLPRKTSVQDYEKLMPWNLDAASLRQKSREI